MNDLFEAPHRRYNPLTGEWVLVSPHRTKRPWQGKVEKAPQLSLDSYDEKCYLCPGNERAGGIKNPKYTSTFVFENDFAALLPDSHSDDTGEDTLFRAQWERGICRVMCFSPRHNETLALMNQEAIVKVVKVWGEQFQELGAKDFINYVQIFENRGDIMGCSNPHPHCQIWANEIIPTIPELETRSQKSYWETHGSSLLSDYIKQEIDKQGSSCIRKRYFCLLCPLVGSVAI